MLIQTDRKELGDFRLNPVEAVAKAREECLALAAPKRLYKQDELEDPNRALGSRLPYGEVIVRLRRLVPSLKVLDGSPGSVALYAPCTHQEVADNTEAWTGDRDIFFLHNKYVGGFPKQDLQEYSTVDIDNAMLATKEHRGWRSVLLNLLKAGLVSYRAVAKEFQLNEHDKRAWRWKEQTQIYRNLPDSKFIEQQGE